MTIESKIKALILSRYRSVREFVGYTDLSYSTVDSILRRGITNSSLSSIMKLCEALYISADELAKGNLVPLNKRCTNDSDMNDMTDLIDIVSFTKQNIKSFENLTIDGKPATHEEIEILFDCFDFAVNVIKKCREDDQK